MLKDDGKPLCKYSEQIDAPPCAQVLVFTQALRHAQALLSAGKENLLLSRERAFSNTQHAARGGGAGPVPGRVSILVPSSLLRTLGIRTERRV